MEMTCEFIPWFWCFSEFSFVTTSKIGVGLHMKFTYFLFIFQEFKCPSRATTEDGCVLFETLARMQGAIARVCMVVAAAILNHPLLFPQENTTLLEQDEELLLRMKEHEERLELWYWCCFHKNVSKFYFLESKCTIVEKNAICFSFIFCLLKYFLHFSFLS